MFSKLNFTKSKEYFEHYKHSEPNDGSIVKEVTNRVHQTETDTFSQETSRQTSTRNRTTGCKSCVSIKILYDEHDTVNIKTSRTTVKIGFMIG